MAAPGFVERRVLGVHLEVGQAADVDIDLQISALQEAITVVFNVFTTANILGKSTINYSGYANVLVRDSNDPANPGCLKSSQFGAPVSTAGGVFGSGGARALQLAARLRF